MRIFLNLKLNKMLYPHQSRDEFDLIFFNNLAFSMKLRSLSFTYLELKSCSKRRHMTQLSRER